MKESRTLEFKSEVARNFLKTVSAYANYGTGVIKFGIRDDGAVVGIVDPDATCLDIEDLINDSISPKPDFRLSVSRRARTVTLTFFEGRNKPYLYRGQAYKRNDTATTEVDFFELKRLTLEGCNMSYVDLPSDVSAPEFGCLKDNVMAVLGLSVFSDDTLRAFGLRADDGKLTIAGSLLSDTNPYCGIDMARFGDSFNVILERKTFAGISILRQYDEAVEVYRRCYQYDKIEGIERTTIETLPEKAFRAAIANALVHRAWDVNAHIRVFMFSDRIEIFSPGGLPGGMSEKDFLNGYLALLRNRNLADVFFRLRLIETLGTGLHGIIEAYSGNALKPQFRFSENAIVVVLPVLSENPVMTGDEQKLLTALDGHVVLSSTDMARQLGWSKDKTVRIVNRLKLAGLVTTLGIGRGTKYARRCGDLPVSF
ncbi:MAG: putative DNA binding domain-containing protein [Succinivibrionaceae bacterium]|nr:putative DNA binding domain-containing protein [Succinivibrionaceae bacterium]